MTYALPRILGSTHTVATVLLPGERPRVDAAGNGCFAVVHRDTIPEAIRVVRERPVDAVLLSVHRCPASQIDALDHLLRDFPDIPTLALVSHHDPASTEALLHLGASGIRQVIDVTSPAGWQRLREVIAGPASRASARIQGPLFERLEDTPADTRLFFEAMIRLAPETVTVRKLATRLQVRPSTLMSRFGRAGLPSPKSYLAAVRLLHASILFEGSGLSVADVAYRLEYSSPQSFGRHVRALLGITSSEFRSRLPFPAALNRFLDIMITPYREVLRDFHPLAAGNGTVATV
ncbi:MAG: helix-turn-helix domain-containing protein [Gemmatimonadota bacterium]